MPIRESENSLKVFLPRRYSEITTDEDIENTNSGNKIFGIVYMGVCPQTKRHLLAISREEDVKNDSDWLCFFITH
jgi:hypothetical protein